MDPGIGGDLCIPVGSSCAILYEMLRMGLKSLIRGDFLEE